MFDSKIRGKSLECLNVLLNLLESEDEIMDNNSLNKSSTLLFSTIGAFFSFFIFGFVDNLKGPTISPLLKELGLSYSNAGMIFLGVYFGFFIAVIFSGIIGDIIGRKLLIIIGGILLFIGVISYS